MPTMFNQQAISNSLEKIPRIIDSSVDHGVKKVGKIIEDSNELIRTPAKWLKNMQTTWLIVVICLTIICLCVLIFYCICQGYCVCRRNNDRQLNNRLAKITMIMAKKNIDTNLNKY